MNYVKIAQRQKKKKKKKKKNDIPVFDQLSDNCLKSQSIYEKKSEISFPWEITISISPTSSLWLF